VTSIKKDDDPPVFSLNWQIYRISRSLTEPSTRVGLPKRSRTKWWIAFGVSVLSIATLFMVMPELVDVPKLTTCIGNKLTDILELITRTLSSI
jgi:hypothetical protein